MSSGLYSGLYNVRKSMCNNKQHKGQQVRNERILLKRSYTICKSDTIIIVDCDI